MPALGSVAVSLFLPEVTLATTGHNDVWQTAYISGESDFTAAERSNAIGADLGLRIAVTGLLLPHYVVELKGVAGLPPTKNFIKKS